MKKIAVVATVKGEYVGRTFLSLSSCAEILNLQISHVSEVLSGTRKQHKGYIFRPLYCDYEERRRSKR